MQNRTGLHGTREVRRLCTEGLLGLTELAMDRRAAARDRVEVKGT